MAGMNYGSVEQFSYPVLDQKTGRLIIMNEDSKSASVSSHISAVVAEEAFDLLRAPIRRVCAPESPIPFSPALEKLWMPDEEDIIKAVKEIV